MGVSPLWGLCNRKMSSDRKYPLRFSEKPIGHPFPQSYLGAPSQTLPSRVDLRHLFKLPVYDQGELGSCTANAICAALQCLLPQTSSFQPSRMFLYANELLQDGDPNMADQGSTLETGCNVLSQLGICSEGLWPYQPSVDFGKCPPPAAYTEALSHKFSQFWHLQPGQYKAVLAQGHPIVIGIMIYPSFETPDCAATGMIPMPQSTESCLGGHAVTVCGYDDSLQCYLLRNSWGAQWGQQGYFWLPYAYLENTSLACDAICILPSLQASRPKEVRVSHRGKSPRLFLEH
jgi:C1A family cysteine protease